MNYKKQTETELKYKLKEFKGTCIPSTEKHIHQIYLNCVDGAKIIKYVAPSNLIDLSSIVEIRLRKINESQKSTYFLTLKTDGDLNRDEHEYELTENDFNYLSNTNSHIGSISKIRYEIDHIDSGLKIEIDQYDSKHKGLFIAEIEFDNNTYTVEKVEKIIKDYFGDDVENVTYDKKYKNRNLALA